MTASSMDLQPGEIVGGRFEVTGLAGKGGMARVYRARDTQSGRDAAVKVLLDSLDAEAERFAREADVLARLSHPAIVGYLARGRDPRGRPFVAMPWIEGETLAARLRRRGPLPFDEVRMHGGAIADALAAAHDAGVVHRDVKPSNVMLLPEGGVVLVDFGVARFVDLSSELTKTNMFVGTPAYIAPEQARGDADVGPTADLYSLGCLLYACVTGHAPFQGDNLVAILAKVLLQPAPRPREERADVPRDLDALIVALMEKEPSERPQSGYAVARTLGSASAPPASVVPRAHGLSLSEARMCSMVFVGASATGAPAPHAGASALARRFGGTLERLANGTLAVRWIEGGDATVRALAAARCALGLRALAPQAAIALATVRAGVDGREAVSGAIDRASVMLGREAPRDVGVRVDVATAQLVGARFEVRDERGAQILVGEREDDEARPVHGVSTPCVGREAELAMLDALLARTADDGAPRAVAVIADAGVGKTRLRQEWLRRQREREGAPVVWLGRGDPLGASSGYGLVARVLRRAMGVRDDETAEVRQARVFFAVCDATGAQDGDARADHAVTFLSELIGAGMSVDGRPALAAARRDPALMGEQLHAALRLFVRATARRRPLVIVLEDPQPEDVGSLRLLDVVLTEEEDLPVLVAVFARPTLDAAVASVWADRRVQRIPLEALSKKASERLVRAVFGGTARDEEEIARIVSLAGGNAFFLEELARARASGDGAPLPESLLAVLEARFDDLSAEDRRVLRAASVFGQVFSPGALEHVLGETADLVDSALARLEAREIVAERGGGRYAGQSDWVFRHALVRDAAYATLTDDDRRRAHGAAAEWLDQAGEPDPGLLAWHFELGGDGATAAERYAAAINQLIGAGAFAQAISVAERALPLAETSEQRAWLWFAISEAAFWAGDNERCARAADEGMRSEPEEASGVFGLCLARRVQMSTRLGDPRADELLARAVAFVRAHPALESIARVTATVGTAAAVSGRRPVVDAVRGLIAEAELLDRADVADRAILYQFLAFAELDDLELRCEYFEKSARACEASGRTRGYLLQQINAATVRGLMGQLEDAEDTLRSLEKEADASNVRFLATAARQELGQVLTRAGRFAEARDLCARAADDFHAQNNLSAEAITRASLARALLGLGEPDAALEEAHAAVALAAARSDARATANVALSDVALAKGLAREALESATKALAAWSEGGVSSGWESAIRLAYVRALRAVGRADEAREAQLEARRSLARRTARMRDEEARIAFLAQPENAALLARVPGE